MMKRLIIVFLIFSTIGCVQAAGVITAVDENGMPDAELVDIVFDFEEQRQWAEDESHLVPQSGKFLADVGRPKPVLVPSHQQFSLKVQKDTDSLSDDVPNL